MYDSTYIRGLEWSGSETERRSNGCQGLGKGSGEGACDRLEFQFCKVKKSRKAVEQQ